MGWEKHGESTNYAHPDVLRFKDGTVFNVRLAADELPTPVWYHSCKDASGNFVKVRCMRTETGVCKLCEANNAPEYAKAGNNERPAPLKVEYAAAVWAMELNRFMLLVGKQVWDRIAEFGKAYGTLMDTRLKITRTNVSGKIEYMVTPFRPEGVMQVPQGTPMPQVGTYSSWLESNIGRVAWVQTMPTSAAPMAAMPSQPSFGSPTVSAPPPPNPFVTAGSGAVTVPGPNPFMAAAAPTPPNPFIQAPAATQGNPFVQAPQGAPAFGAPVQAAAAPPDEAECARLRSRFLLLTKSWFDPAAAEQMINSHGKGVQMEHKTLDQLKGLIAEYESQIRARGLAVPA